MLNLLLEHMYKRNIKLSDDKFLTIVFITTLIVANIKGNAFFVPTSFFRLFTLFYTYCIFIDSQKIKRLTQWEQNFKAIIMHSNKSDLH